VVANNKIENWTLWIIGDLIVTPLYAYRGLGMLSLQYLIFTILAIYAYLEWRKSYARAICNYKNRNVWPRKYWKTTLAFN
jgi:nicotinamide riboside transporter PnuC